MRFLPFAAFLLVFFSCSVESDRPLLNIDNLESWKFSVDEDTDSVLKTPKGALLKIEKGTFAGKVELEVKEAYTMRDMLLGGLSTTSNGQPLSSGGMIYLNSSDEKELQLLKPISVALPTPYVNTEMQVFKGEVSGDSINWINPDTLPANSINTSLELGRQLFQQSCATCHNIYVDRTGPALWGFRRRGPWNSNIELRKWVRNPARYMDSNQYTRDLARKMGVVMQAFPSLSDSQIDALAAYIENEQNSPYAASLLGADGLCTDSVLIPDADTSDITPDLSPVVFAEDSTASDTSLFDTNALQDPLSGGAYVFKITSPGWYNIDILMDKLPGAMPCDVEIKSFPSDSLLTVKLLIPKYRIMLPGSYENGVFTFLKGDEKPQFVYGTDAVVIGFGEGSEKFYYGAIKFAMAEKVSLTLSLKEGGKDDFEALLRNQQLDGSTDSVQAKADAEIRKAFRAIAADVKRDSIRIVSFPCGDLRPVADSVTAVSIGYSPGGR